MHLGSFVLLLPHLVPGVSLALSLSLETRRQVLTRLPPLPVPFSLPKPALWSPEAGIQLTHSAAQAGHQGPSLQQVAAVSASQAVASCVLDKLSGAKPLWEE